MDQSFLLTWPHSNITAVHSNVHLMQIYPRVFGLHNVLDYTLLLSGCPAASTYPPESIPETKVPVCTKYKEDSTIYLSLRVEFGWPEKKTVDISVEAQKTSPNEVLVHHLLY